MRALRPARTVLCHARLSSALPELFKQNVIAAFVFSDSRCKTACRFVLKFSSIGLPTKLCPDLVSFVCWIVTEFWSFTRKSAPHLVIRALNYARFCVVCALNCPILCRLRTKLCPNFGRSHAKLCPIYFAPCPFHVTLGGCTVQRDKVFVTGRRGCRVFRQKALRDT